MALSSLSCTITPKTVRLLTLRKKTVRESGSYNLCQRVWIGSAETHTAPRQSRECDQEHCFKGQLFQGQGFVLTLIFNEPKDEFNIIGAMILGERRS